MNAKLAVTITACAMIAMSLNLSGHHSFSAEFDTSKLVSVTGKLTKVEWNNPHCWFFVDVIRTDGSRTNWGADVGPPHLLAGQGWTKERVLELVGTTVTMTGNPAKNGTPRMGMRNLKTEKGVMPGPGQALTTSVSAAITR